MGLFLSAGDTQACFRNVLPQMVCMRRARSAMPYFTLVVHDGCAHAARRSFVGRAAHLLLLGGVGWLFSWRVTVLLFV